MFKLGILKETPIHLHGKSGGPAQFLSNFFFLQSVVVVVVVAKEEDPFGCLAVAAGEPQRYCLCCAVVVCSKRTETDRRAVSDRSCPSSIHFSLLLQKGPAHSCIDTSFVCSAVLMASPLMSDELGCAVMSAHVHTNSPAATGGQR
jgi:hypothetical protein